jgi:hypothetical protein
MSLIFFGVGSIPKGCAIYNVSNFDDLKNFILNVVCFS